MPHTGDSLICCGLGPCCFQPPHKHAVTKRKNDGTNEKSDNPGIDHATDGTNQDHRHGDIHSAPEKKWFKKRITETNQEGVEHENQRWHRIIF